MTLEKIDQALKSVHCPICLTQKFDLKLRCDLSFDRCLRIVECCHCGHQYDAVQLVSMQKPDVAAV